MKLMELYQDKIVGAIRGLDRIRFRGTLRWLASKRGLATFMGHSHILLKDFAEWVNGLTAQIRSSCQCRAEELGIAVRYLASSGVNKEKLARQIAMENGITEGSICMFSVVEPCIAPTVKGNKATQKLEVTMAHRKCVWVYHYFDDPELGFGHVRLQTWLPFTVFICLNGRHWLERQLQNRGMGYRYPVCLGRGIGCVVSPSASSCDACFRQFFGDAVFGPASSGRFLPCGGDP